MLYRVRVAPGTRGVRLTLRPAVLLWPLLVACTGGKDSGLGTGDCPASNTVHLQDANNYGFQGTLDIASVDVKAYTDADPTDYRIDWSGVAFDLQGHPVSPTDDIDLIGMVNFPYLSQEEVEVALATDSLLASDLEGGVSVAVDGATETMLSDLTLFGNPVDPQTYLTVDSGVYMLIAASGGTLGVGTRQLQFVHPVAEEVNTDILLGDDSTQLTFDVDLQSLTPVKLIADADYFTLDWSELTTDGLGSPIDLGHIDQAEVAWFSDATIPDLEAGFLQIEIDADSLWEAAIPSGSDVALADLVGDGAFPGISADGTWVLALNCSTCSNPAPQFFTVLTPCTPE